MKKLTATLLALVMLLTVCSALADTGFTVQNVKYDTATLAKAAVVDGYTLYSAVNCCDETTCLGYPVRVTAMETKGDVMMMYYSGENYIERISHSMFTQQEGTLDQEFAIFMKSYMPAYNYCWDRATQILNAMGVDAQLSGTNLDDMTSFDQAIAAREKYIYDNIVPGMQAYGMNVEWVEATAAERVFSFTVSGQKYYIAVMAEVFGYQYSTSLYNTRSTIWEAPYYFAMICPEAMYQEVHDNDFRIFRENTGTNDEFIALNEKLTEKIKDEVIANWNMVCAASMAYMETMTALTFSMVEGTLGGSYSNADRFSDYIFDQNDYTTLDGDHVKVSTSYDYVYQSGSSVYFTNDALSIPAGATMLDPN